MLSIIICSITPSRFEFQKQQYARLLGAADVPYEVVGIHDAKSLAEGYNRGVQHANPQATHFIFAHDDIEIISPDFVPKLKRSLDQFDVIGIAGTSRCIGALWAFAGPGHIFGQVVHFRPPPINAFDVEIFGNPTRLIGGMQAMDGVFLAARRSVVERVRWDEQTFDGWHLYDLDWTYRAHLAGFRLAVACDISLIHASSGNTDEIWAGYAKKFDEKHGATFSTAYPRREFVVAHVRTREQKDLLDIMTPPWWPPFVPQNAPLRT